MIKMMMGVLKEIETNDEFFATVAKILKKMHTALKDAGFTEDQATEIVASQGIGTKTS